MNILFLIKPHFAFSIEKVKVSLIQKLIVMVPKLYIHQKKRSLMESLFSIP